MKKQGKGLSDDDPCFCPQGGKFSRGAALPNAPSTAHGARSAAATELRRPAPSQQHQLRATRRILMFYGSTFHCAKVLHMSQITAHKPLYPSLFSTHTHLHSDGSI